MKSLKNLPIAVKFAIFFSLIGFLTLCNHLTNLYFEEAREKQALINDYLIRNIGHAKRIPLYVYPGHERPDSISAEIRRVNEAVDLLKNGGVLRESDIVVSPVSDNRMKSALAEFEEYWSKFSVSALSLARKSQQLNHASDSTNASELSMVNSEADNLANGMSTILLSKINSLSRQQDLALANANQVRHRLQLGFTFLSIVCVCLFYFVSVSSIASPLNELHRVTASVATGEIDVRVISSSKDEIGMINAKLATHLDNLKGASSFAQEIARGNFSSAYKPAGEKDRLGQSLLYMREKLNEVAMEDKKRNWGTEGLARFSEILRNDQNDLGKLSTNVLSSLVKYLQANQGSIFIVNDENPADVHLHALSTYAWDKKKFVNRRIEVGEGLCGQAWQEGEMIYLREIPSNYIAITSGLGYANPRSLLIVPLKTNDEIFGILELASLKDFEEHEREFVLKLSETIASTLSSAKISQRTSRLLEQSQQQAEELRAQEEEMRQNMEELQATQEEMTRKNKESESRIQAIDESGVASIEFNLDGTIITANGNFLTLMGYRLDEIQGKHHRIFVESNYSSSSEYKQFWEDLRNGIPRPGQYERITKTGNRVTIQGSYSVIRDGNGVPFRILKLANDISSLVNRTEEMRLQKDAWENRIRAIDDGGVSSVEFAVDGTILDANENFLSLMGYTLDEIKGRHHRMFVDPKYAVSKEYNSFWQDLRSGIARPGQYERVTKSGERVFIQGGYSIIRDHKGVPTRILKVAMDISSVVKSGMASRVLSEAVQKS